PGPAAGSRRSAPAGNPPAVNNGDVIRRIPGVRGAQAYLHQSREGLAVIDPGYTGSFRAVLRYVEAQALGRIDWVILTHHHIDHAGTALALCQATGARLAVHAADAAYLQPRRPRERMTLWGLADRLPSAPHRLAAATYERAYFGHGPAIMTGADQCVRAFLTRRTIAPALTG